MSDPITRLNAALEGRYHIESELGRSPASGGLWGAGPSIFVTTLAVVLAACGGSDGVVEPDAEAPVGISVDPPIYRFVALGRSEQFHAKVVDASGAVLASAPTTWSVADERVVLVTTSGLVTAQGNGTTWLTVSSGSAQGQAQIVVQQEAVQLVVDPPEVAADSVGQEFTFTVSAIDGEGYTVGSVEAPTFQSSDDSVFVVTSDSTGVITGYGDAQLVAQNQGLEVRVRVALEVRFCHLSAGIGFTCGVTRTHAKLLCWGKNDRGELGNGTRQESFRPRLVAAAEQFVTVSSGNGHSCAVTVDGAVFCWGLNDEGQVGVTPGEPQTRPLRVSVATASGIASGGWHSCGLDSGGIGLCWGRNKGAELGVGSRETWIGPVEIAGGRTFSDISTFGQTTCALDDRGAAHCWGRNFNGSAGIGREGTLDTPTAVAGDHTFGAISVGFFHVCALAQDSTVWCWGRNDDGQLGDGSTIDRHLPTRVQLEGEVVSVTAGYGHSCAVTADGSAYCWGVNNYGGLGDGTKVKRSIPVPVETEEAFASLAAGSDHTCGLTEEGVAFCWGLYWNGQLGSAPVGDALVPQSVFGSR